MAFETTHAGGLLAARLASEAGDGAWAPSPAFRYGLAAIVAGALGTAVVLLGRDPQAGALQLSLILGAAFGFVLQRSRF